MRREGVTYSLIVGIFLSLEYCSGFGWSASGAVFEGGCGESLVLLGLEDCKILVGGKLSCRDRRSRRRLCKIMCRADEFVGVCIERLAWCLTPGQAETDLQWNKVVVRKRVSKCNQGVEEQNSPRNRLIPRYCRHGTWIRYQSYLNNTKIKGI